MFRNGLSGVVLCVVWDCGRGVRGLEVRERRGVITILAILQVRKVL